MSPNGANSPVGPARRQGGRSPGRPRPGLFRSGDANSIGKIGLVPDRGADDPVRSGKSPTHPFGGEGQGKTPVSIHRNNPASTAELSQRGDHRQGGLLQGLTAKA